MKEQEHYLQEQIEELVIGLKENLDISYYANAFFDWYQMREIRIGLEHKLDVKNYANQKIDYYTMRQIRKGMEIGLDLFSLYQQGYHASVLREIRRAYEKNIDLIPYARQQYDYMQLREITKAYEKHCNIDPYLKLELSGAQLSEIRIGLEHKVDVTKYAQKSYTWMQMQEIRLGLEKGLDISCYKSKYFGYMEMREIRLGLERGLDVSSYAKLCYCSDDMRNYRLFMLQNQTGTKDEIDELFQTVLNRKEICVDQIYEQSNIMLEISDTEMEAYIKLIPSQNQEYRVRDICSYLKSQGVLLGIDSTKIEDAIQNKQYWDWIQIANGKEAIAGDNGFIEYSIDMSANKKPTINEDGSVDYNHLQYNDFVEEGQLIAKYHAATNGIYGYRVTGSMIVPEKGKEISLIAGEGIKKDGNCYYATQQGRVELNKNYIQVNKIYRHDGDYTTTMGYLKFNGDVYINGNVESGVRIKASGDIIVEKNVADAFLEAMGDITIKRGVCGKGGGLIKAEGKIRSKFFENALVKANGNVEANYILNSNVISLSNVIVNGKKGFIIGGWIQALNYIDTYYLGNNAYMETRVELGIGKAVREIIVLRNSDIENCENEIVYYKQKLKDMELAYTPEELTKFPMYRKVQELIEGKRKKIQDIENYIAFIRKQNQKYTGSTQLFVRRVVYPNVSIVINGAVRKVEEESNMCKFYLNGKRVCSEK